MWILTIKRNLLHQVIHYCKNFLARLFCNIIKKNNKKSYNFFFCEWRTECADRGGTASGNCANGYGVCCVSEFVFSVKSISRILVCFLILWKINYFLNFLKVSLECGGTSRDNCTYMQLGPRSTFTSSNEVCTYKVCQTNDKVCRIRLDFQVSSTTVQFMNIKKSNKYLYR